MKYKVGQKVRVKKDLEIGRCYGASFVNGMKKYKELTIVKCVCDGNYNMKEDSGRWNWTNEMLEPLHRELKDIQYGDVITDGEIFIYILGRVDEAIFVSEEAYTEEDVKEAIFFATYSLTEFIEDFRNYKIVGQEEDTTEELTMEEVCKQLGKTVKIKK